MLKRNILWCLHIPFRESVQWSLRPCNGKRNSWRHLSLSYKMCQFTTSALSSPIATQCPAAASSQPGWGKLSSPCTVSFIPLNTKERGSRKCSAFQRALRMGERAPVHTAQDLVPESQLDCRVAGPSLVALTRFQFSRKGTSRWRNARTWGKALPCVTVQVKRVFEVGMCMTCLTGLGL